MAAIDDRQLAVADDLVKELLTAPAGQSAVWNLAGTVGAGKSSVLRLVERGLLASPDVVTVMMAPPGGDLDTASIALLETAVQLKARDLINGQMTDLSDPSRRWDAKMAIITDAVEQHADKVVILCDEPTRWYNRRESVMDDVPDYHARNFADWILGHAKCRRVIAGWMPNDVPPEKQKYAPYLEDVRPYLAEESEWGETAPLATELHQALPRAPLQRSLWEVKLLVALSRVNTLREVAVQASRLCDVQLLLEELLHRLETHSEYRPICESLARLALARTPVDRQTFNSLTPALSPTDRAIIASCLCEVDEGRLRLHPLVRYEVAERAVNPRRAQTGVRWRLSSDERETVHRRLQETYEHGSPGSASSEWESLHHELLGGRAELRSGDGRLRFIEQLQEIGRTLSRVYKDYPRAARLFRFAVEIDPHQAYSHHYLAFNLDFMAEEPAAVEWHYQEAIRLQPRHPWWWSRWISYLVTRGQFKQARGEWRKALGAMSVSEDGSPPWLYLSLHRWVAAWLLHWSDLAFAEEVLKSIPSDVTSELDIQLLWDRFDALKRRSEGTPFFP